jgi:hypothetical protein
LKLCTQMIVPLYIRIHLWKGVWNPHNLFVAIFVQGSQNHLECYDVSFFPCLVLEPWL